MSVFTRLLVKAVETASKDHRIGTYRAPELQTPEFGSAHRQYGKRVYPTFALIHSLQFLIFAETANIFLDSSSWSTAERRAHLQKHVGKHRRRVR